MNDLYQKCEACDGGTEPPCPLCNGVGFVKIGLTLGQVNRMVDNERALAGDPGIPLARRAELVGKLAAACHMAFERMIAEPPDGIDYKAGYAAFDGNTPRQSDTISHKTRGSNA